MMLLVPCVVAYVYVQARTRELVALIEARWRMLHTCLHAAGYLLDPEHYGQDQERVEEVMLGFHEFVGKTHENVADQAECVAQYECYRNKQGLFASATAWAAAKIMPAHAWWLQFGGGVPLLQDVAVKALAQVGTCVFSWLLDVMCCGCFMAGVDAFCFWLVALQHVMVLYLS